MSNSLISTSQYLVEREALLIDIEMGNYLIDYYLHRRQCAPGTLSEHDEKLKELIACFAVHLTVHPAVETHAWTVHMISEHPYSLFVTGSAGALDAQGIAHGFIVGHVLTEHIRYTDVNSFHAQFTDSKGTLYKSYVKCESSEISTMVELFYEQSEQLPLRITLSKTSDTALSLAAVPGFDREWFQNAKLEEVAAGLAETKKPMRVCKFDFICDCSPKKLLPFFRSLSNETVSELYGNDKALIISCPRCGKDFSLSRKEIDAVDV